MLLTFMISRSPRSGVRGEGGGIWEGEGGGSK